MPRFAAQGDNVEQRQVISARRRIIDADLGGITKRPNGQWGYPCQSNPDDMMKTVDKAVAAVIRRIAGRRELLVFDHPTAGTQLVKGTVDRGERLEDAVVRELFEESGLAVDSGGLFIGSWERIAGAGPEETGPMERHLWHVFVLHAPGHCPTAWSHTATGSPAEEGLVFKFRWVSINDAVEHVHPLFVPVAHLIKAHEKSR